MQLRMEESVKGTLFGAAALLLSTSALGAAPPEQAAEQTAEQEPKKERKICRTEKSTGSLTRRTRVCLTREQWQELHGNTRAGLDDLVRNASGGCMAPKNGGTMC